MKRIWIFVVGIIVIIGLMMVGIGQWWPQSSARPNDALTIQVVTPDTTEQSSIDLHAPLVQIPASGTAVWHNTSGEAVIVSSTDGQFSSGVLPPNATYPYLVGFGTYTVTITALDGRLINQQVVEVLP